MDFINNYQPTHMEDQYPSFQEIKKQLTIKKRTIQTIMEDNDVYGWPEESSLLQSFISNDPRLTDEAQSQLLKIDQEILDLKIIIRKKMASD